MNIGNIQKKRNTEIVISLLKNQNEIHKLKIYTVAKEFGREVIDCNSILDLCSSQEK